jgi:hypothetical protein
MLHHALRKLQIRPQAGLLLLLGPLSCFAQSEWQPLIGWQATPFKNHATPVFENKDITLPFGQPMTGITRPATAKTAFPTLNYEIRWEATRTTGNDFFSSLTFPVADSFCTLVTGGWGGDIVGLSSIDGWDASENETRTYFNFENKRWYKFRLRVEANRIQAWIDEKSVVDLAINGRNIGLRREDMKLTTPLGFLSYNSTGILRNIEYRSLKP